MLNLVSFGASSILFGVLLTIVATIIMFLAPSIALNRKHTTMSYILIVLFTLFLLIGNILFFGIIKSRQTVSEYATATADKVDMLKSGKSLLDELLPDLSDLTDIANDLVDAGKDRIDEQFRATDQALKKYMIICIVVCILMFAAGLTLTCLTAEQQRRRSSYSSSRGGSRDYSHSSRGDDYRPRRNTDSYRPRR